MFFDARAKAPGKRKRNKRENEWQRINNINKTAKLIFVIRWHA